MSTEVETGPAVEDGRTTVEEWVKAFTVRTLMSIYSVATTEWNESHYSDERAKALMIAVANEIARRAGE